MGLNKNHFFFDNFFLKHSSKFVCDGTENFQAMLNDGVTFFQRFEPRSKPDFWYTGGEGMVRLLKKSSNETCLPWSHMHEKSRWLNFKMAQNLDHVSFYWDGSLLNFRLNPLVNTVLLFLAPNLNADLIENIQD